MGYNLEGGKIYCYYFRGNFMMVLLSNLEFKALVTRYVAMLTNISAIYLRIPYVNLKSRKIGFKLLYSSFRR